MTPDELPGYLSGIAAAVAEQAALAAANAMADAFLTELVTVTLIRSTHSRGSPTPAAPGLPPALVSGALRRSVRKIPAVSLGPGRAMSGVSPTIIYARIQERGGTVTSKGSYPLRNRQTGQVFGHSVTLPARPYMRPTATSMAASGKLSQAGGAAVRAVVVAAAE